MMGICTLCGQLLFYRRIIGSWIKPLPKAFNDHINQKLDGKAGCKLCFCHEEEIAHKIELSRILFIWTVYVLVSMI
jgi:hypothetical protein